MDTHKPKKVRKQFVLDPELLAEAKDAAGAKTDTETVVRGLKILADNKRSWQALRQWAESGKGHEHQLEDVYHRLEPLNSIDDLFAPVDPSHMFTEEDNRLATAEAEARARADSAG